MATYVSLINWTEQGIRNFRETVDRFEAGKQQGASLGVDLKDVYWTVGQYDIVLVADAPDEETLTAFLLGLGALGNVRTTTLRGFSPDEMRGIIGRVT
jgi:uncharacterized protein with GYD domain